MYRSQDIQADIYRPTPNSLRGGIRRGKRFSGMVRRSALRAAVLIDGEPLEPKGLEYFYAKYLGLDHIGN